MLEYLFYLGLVVGLSGRAVTLCPADKSWSSQSIKAKAGQGVSQQVESRSIGCFTKSVVETHKLYPSVKVGHKRGISSRLTMFHLHRVLLVFKPFCIWFHPCLFETFAHTRCSFLHSKLLFTPFNLGRAFGIRIETINLLWLASLQVPNY